MTAAQYFVIRHKDDWDLFWNKETGWGDTESETRFTLEERKNLQVPIEGVWCECGGLDDYTVTYIYLTNPEKHWWFDCKAVDGDHAREQCRKANPEAIIIQVEWNP